MHAPTRMNANYGKILLFFSKLRNGMTMTAVIWARTGPCAVHVYIGGDDIWRIFFSVEEGTKPVYGRPVSKHYIIGSPHTN
jgi:hypothetical protein